MKKINYLTVLFLGFIAFTPFTYGQTKPGIPKPPVPISEAGVYVPVLKEAGELLEKKELKNFYELISSLGNQIHATRRQHEKEGKPRHTRENVTAELWWHYYIASAPLMEANWSYSEENIRVKRISTGINYATEKKAGALSIDSQKLKNLLCSYSAAQLKSLKDFHCLAEKNKKRAEAVEWKMRYCKELGIKREELLKNQFTIEHHYGTVLSYLDTYNLDRDGERLVEELLHAFPRDGTKVREYLKKAGFTTNLEQARILQKTVGRTKENKYLYEGLPTEKEVTAEVNQEYPRLLKADEQRKKEYEARRLIQEKELNGREGKALQVFTSAAARVLTEDDAELRKRVLAEAEKQLNATLPKIMAKDIFQMTDEDDKTLLFTYSKIFSEITDRFIKEADAKLDEATLKAKQEKRNRGYAFFRPLAELLYQ